MSPLMFQTLEVVRRYGRPFKYALQRRHSARLAAEADGLDRTPVDFPVAFVIACGRSGTTLLGAVLSQHPRVHYLFEPYAMWGAIDPRTDITNLWFGGEVRCRLDREDATDRARARFEHMFLRQAQRSGADLLVEKTPINALRLGFLDELAPGARYVHIVRDCLDVCRSIDSIASRNLYKFAGRPRLSQWWGDGDCKWSALVEDGIAAGLFPDEIDALRSHAQRGAYEWLFSHHEVDGWREHLGGRLHEMRYDDLTTSPRPTLERLVSFLGVPADAAWLDAIVPTIDAPRRRSGKPLPLPPGMAAAVNALQERFGFDGRVEVLEPGRTGA